MSENDSRAKLVELMEQMPIAMMTTYGPDGPRSVPMARQEVEPDAEMFGAFVAAESHGRLAELPRPRRHHVTLPRVRHVFQLIT